MDGCFDRIEEGFTGVFERNRKGGELGIVEWREEGDIEDMEE